MDILSKFDTVTIQTDNRITEDDREYCIANQKAYDAARSCFQELVYIWDDLTSQQSDILTGLDSESYGKEAYLPSHDDLKISAEKINDHIISLHSRLICRLVQYFNGKYHVSVNASVIDSHLLPERPTRDWQRSWEDEERAYEEKMLSLSLHYQDILNEIFVQLDGRNFREQALFELKEKCRQSAWNNYNKTAKYEIKKDVLRFSSYACSYDSWFSNERWKLQDDMKKILRGIAHYETGSFSILPLGFSNLLSYDGSNTDLVQFSGCAKVLQLKLFKNGRVDIKFSSEKTVRAFAEQYLSLVYYGGDAS